MINPPPCARLPPKRAQTGFLLPQLALVVVIGAMVAAYAGNRYWQDTLNQSRDSKAKLIGERLASISDATKTYATTFFTQIQRGDSVTRNGYTLAPQRLLAPTLTDLSGLGFLPATAVNAVVYNGQSIQFGIAMRINTQSGCTIPTCSLLFQVTTSEPLLIPDRNTVDVRRATLAADTASPGNAGVSLPGSMGGDPSVFVANGGAVIGANASGVAGLVSINNGYDSQGFFEFLRRDGSLPMTGSLNMQDSAGTKHDITNANDIDAVNMTASEAITGKTVSSTGRLKTGEYLQISGRAVEGQRCEANTVGLTSAGVMLTCQPGTGNQLTWGQLKTYNFVKTTIAAVNKACTTGDPDNPPHYDRLAYQMTCGKRFCDINYGYRFGILNEYGAGYNLTSPYNSALNTPVDVACSR
jgi:hypothetical protein